MPRWGRLSVVFLTYLVVATCYTWPLVRQLGTLVPSDTGDPQLNIAILWWNATTLPFSPAWWNAPHYYPAHDIAAFTENLTGLSAIFSPVFWLTGNPIAAYNVAFFLTGPLSATATYLLARSVSTRGDGAFLAGLAFALTPYRTTEIAHLQMLSAYGMPLALLGLHLYLQTGRAWSLALFGGAWLLQSLINGHFLLFGAVLIALWILYFCSTPGSWRTVAPILGVWTLTSLPLVPVLLHYRAVHTEYGLGRSFNEILAFSARPRGWLEVSGDVWFWRSFLPTGKDDLFPGLTIPLLVLLAGLSFGWQQRIDGWSRARRVGRRIVAAVFAISLAAVLGTLAVGPWATTIAGVLIRMNTLGRGLAVAAVSGLALTCLTPSWRAALSRRSPIVFYTGAALVLALLACGPALQVGDTVILAPAPYRWLMALPGFGELRVPARFWMLGVLCLSVAGGLAFSRIRTTGWPGALLLVAAVGGVMVDGWMPTLRMATPAAMWPLAEPSTGREPVLELPIGPDFDWDATFRAASHRRRVFNGVSGYNPPHYIALVTALQARDHSALTAMASLGAFEIVVNRTTDPDGAWARFAASAPGAVVAPGTGAQVVVHVPAGPAEPSPGPALPVATIEGVRYAELFARDDRDAVEMHDGDLASGWTDVPQQPGQWVVIDLGLPREVGGLTHALGDHFLDFPRRLAIEVSMDQRTWSRVWEGPTAAEAFLALVRGPREGAMRFTFPSRTGRFVRLLQLDANRSGWHIADLQVHEPQR